MTDRVTNVAVLGSTGSIGRSTLEVIAASGGGCGRWRCRPTATPICCCGRPRACGRGESPSTDPAAAGAAGLVGAARRSANCSSARRRVARLAADPEVDIVVSAIVGSAGLRSTWAALEAGKTVALANKESLVVGGPLVTELGPAEKRQNPPRR